MLLAALGAVLGMLGAEPAADALPSAVPVRRFERVTDDGFFISIESWDPKFDATATADAAGIAGRPPRRAAGVQRTMDRTPAERIPAAHALEPASGDWRRRWRVIGAAGSALLGAANPKQFWCSWLVAFLFFLSLALGALFFVLIQHASQGAWGIVLRRVGETIFACCR